MSKDLNINVHHLTRVEGHGNIVVPVFTANGRAVGIFFIL